jgi:gliding motility-associated lipoprotein GldB
MISPRSFQIYSFFLIVIILSACKDRKQVDVSNIKLSITIERFDQEINTLNPQNITQKIPQLQKQYGDFYADYMEQILGVGRTSDTSYYKNLRAVLSNNDYKELKDAVAEKFPNLSNTEEELTEAFKHIRYYFPSQKFPRLISFFSGFSVQTPIGNNYIGIGLDMFLGANSKFYPALRQSIPEYISRRFTPENITPRIVEAFVREDMFPENDKDRSFLAKAIYNGKILFLMESFMPVLADTSIIGYTNNQLEWSQTNEANLWGYFLESNLLFETDYMKIQKYLTDAPFTPGLGENNESAPKLGVFIGWQIVKKYMEKHPDITLEQLMQETDYQKILKQSKYKPK